MTIKQFVAKNKIRMTAEMVDSNPNMTDMVSGSTHWRCTLRCGHKQMTVPFSQGPAICREPQVDDVLDCLASDAAGFENATSFEEWASEYGFDPDSRKAERTYRAIERQTTKLAKLLSVDAYGDLLWKAERL